MTGLNNQTNGTCNFWFLIITLKAFAFIRVRFRFRFCFRFALCRGTLNLCLGLCTLRLSLGLCALRLSLGLHFRSWPFVVHIGRRSFVYVNFRFCFWICFFRFFWTCSFRFFWTLRFRFFGHALFLLLLFFLGFDLCRFFLPLSCRIRTRRHLKHWSKSTAKLKCRKGKTLQRRSYIHSWPLQPTPPQTQTESFRWLVEALVEELAALDSS